MNAIKELIRLLYLRDKLQDDIEHGPKRAREAARCQLARTNILLVQANPADMKKALEDYIPVNRDIEGTHLDVKEITMRMDFQDWCRRTLQLPMIYQ